MRISVDALRGGLHRVRDRLRSAAGLFDVDLGGAGIDRQYELWACAMAPELVSLAALMAMAENDPPAASRGLLPDRN